ncbi:MAG TPA: ATP-binding protein [Opitutaceae bacterium]|nr:ATP-binding protein [Opitutaceae bacterium]
MTVSSIRFRLTAWYAGLLTVVVVALGALFFFHIKSYLEQTLLETQARRARQISDTLVANAGRTGEAYVAREVVALYDPEKSDRFIRITGRDGRLVYVSGVPFSQAFDPASVPAAPPSRLAEFTRKQPIAGGPALLVAAVRTGAGGDSYLVEVGTSAAPVETMFRHLLLLLGLGLPVVAALAASGGYILIRRTLRPVDEIAGKAEQITQHNLSERLPVPKTGDELESLSTALNRMITRLDDAFLNSKRFVADASHELRTPLTVLRGELESMIQDAGVSAEQREQIGGLLEEVERLSMIVERLFALSRLDAGEAQSEWVRFDLAELATTTAGQMTLLAEDRRITVTCDTATPVPVDGDRSRLKQVVVNLLDNAIKYTPEGGAVRLRVFAAQGLAVLEVIDTGVGIPPADLPRIFQRFFRVDQTRSQHPGGAGLGLAIVESICNANRGEVGVESAPSKGSCFRVKLPLAARPGAAAPGKAQRVDPV